MTGDIFVQRAYRLRRGPFRHGVFLFAAPTDADTEDMVHTPLATPRVHQRAMYAAERPRGLPVPAMTIGWQAWDATTAQQVEQREVPFAWSQSTWDHFGFWFRGCP